MNENLKYIEAGLRAAEGIRMTHRRIWMILQIEAQISANENVGIKEMVELRLEADRLFDADGNLKPEEKADGVGSPKQRKTGFDFGATRDIVDGQVCFIATLEDGIVFQPKRHTYRSGDKYERIRDNGGIFKNRQACAIFCDYINPRRP